MKGTILEVDEKGAIVELQGGVTGQIRASEISRDRVEDARMALKTDEELEAKFVGVDRKNRVISLSIKAKEASEEAQVVKSYKTDSEVPSSGTSLGDLLKEQMGPE